jgi:hypothetical protein
MRRIQETALIRAFSVRGQDAFIGCFGVLDGWVEYTTVSETTVTMACTEEHWTHEGFNQAWAADPCCNQEARWDQCCAPKYKTRNRQVIADINATRIAEYAVFAESQGVATFDEARATALKVAISYQTEETKAGASGRAGCLAPVKEYNDRVDSDGFRTKIDECRREVEGEYNEDVRGTVGEECSLDSDCATLECAKFVDSQGTESSKKYCRSVQHTSSGDRFGPVIRCLLRLEDPLMQGAVFSTLKLPASATEEDIVEAFRAKEGYVRGECMAQDGVWHPTKESCESSMQCSWHYNKDGDDCTNPCEKGGINCTGFCKGPGFGDTEKSQLPQCSYRNQMDFSHCDERREQERQAGEVACNECREPCYDHDTWMACYNEGYTLCEGLDENFCQNTCGNDFTAGNCTCCENAEGWYDPWRCQLQQQCQEDVSQGCQEKSEECIAACNGVHCFSWKHWERVAEECRDEYCKERLGPDAMLNPFGHSYECIKGSASFSPERRDTCLADCENGPQPRAAPMCTGHLNVEQTAHGTCYSIAHGWIEERHPDYWDWEKDGPARAERCIVRSFEMRDGEVYVPAPELGFTCPSELCATALRQCLPGHCDHTTYERCSERYDAFRETIDQCRNKESCRGAGCYRRDYRCVNEAGLYEDADFLMFGCDKCSGHWYEHEMRAEHCAMGVVGRLEEAECPLWDGVAEEVPCAHGCMWQMCNDKFRTCKMSGTAPSDCEDQLQELNQCRDCSFVRCDSDCKRKTCDEFHWSGQPEESCGGCPNTDTYKCNSESACYSDRSCWGEKDPFGSDCPRGCEDLFHDCRDDKQRHCWASTGEKNEWGHDQSFESWCHRQWEGSIRTWEVDLGLCPDALGDTWYHQAWDFDDHQATIATCIEAMPYSVSDWAAFQSTCDWELWNRNTDSPCLDHRVKSCLSATFCTFGPETDVTFCTWRLQRDNDGMSWDDAKKNCTADKVASMQAGDETKYTMENGCFTCHGQWNNWADMWEEMHGETCLSDISASYSVCSTCIPVTCAGTCWEAYEEARDCEHTMLYYAGEEVWGHFCAKPHAEVMSSTASLAAITCSSCDLGECAWECQSPCSSAFDWADSVETMWRRCAACSAGDSWHHGNDWEPQCYPGAECYLDPSEPLLAARAESDGRPDPTWIYFTELQECFPTGFRNYRRQLQEDLEKVPERRQALEMVERSWLRFDRASRVEPERRLVETTWAQLVCSGDNCAEAEQMCDLFWSHVNATYPQIYVSHGREMEEHNMPEHLCDRYDKVCYISTADYMAMFPNVTDIYCEYDWYKDQLLDGGNCPLADCQTGCATADGWCDWCCRCHIETRDLQMTRDSHDDSWKCNFAQVADGRNALAAIRALTGTALQEALDYACWSPGQCDEVSAASNAQYNSEYLAYLGVTPTNEDYISYDQELFGGNGGCKRDWWSYWERNKPEECKNHNHHFYTHEEWLAYYAVCEDVQLTADMCPTGFSNYSSTVRWNGGYFFSQETCEAESCYPHGWVTSEESCERHKGCEGGCTKCMRHWGDTSGNSVEAICTLTTSDGEQVGKVDCSLENGTYILNNATGEGICMVPAPVIDTGSQSGDVSVLATCARAPKTSTVERAQSIYYHPLTCEDFAATRQGCGWAVSHPELSALNCYLGWGGCDTEEECESAGWCQYHTWDHLVEQDDGLCTLPHNATPFVSDDGWGHQWIDVWRRCHERVEPGFSFQSTHYGCNVFLGYPQNNSGTVYYHPTRGMKPENCTAIGGQWFQFAMTAVECLAPASERCCLRQYGDWCEQWSQDDKTSCASCGGTWRSTFQWGGGWNRWVEAKWDKKNVWATRGLTAANKWVDQLDEWQLEEVVNAELQKLGAVVVAGYLQCRGSAANAALESIADALMPPQPLGEMTPIPGQAMTKCVRGFCVVVSKDATLGSTIELADMPAVAFLAMNPAEWTTTLEPTTAAPTAEPAGNETNVTTPRKLEQEKRIEEGAVEETRKTPSEKRRLTDLSSLPSSCYTTVRSSTSDEYVGQVVGGCMEITVGDTAVSGLSLDLPVDPEIPRNPDFTVWAVAQQQFTASGPALVATSLTAEYIRQETEYLLRTSIPSSGMYCPAARLPDNSRSVAVSGCDELAVVQDAVLAASGGVGNVFGSPTPAPTFAELTLAPAAPTGATTPAPTPIGTPAPTTPAPTTPAPTTPSPTTPAPTSPAPPTPAPTTPALPTPAPTTPVPITPAPTPTGTVEATVVVTTMALAVSAEALDTMMANPTEAVAGLAQGFADFLGVPADQVVVTKTVPDLFGASGRVRKLSEGSQLEVEYEVVQAPGEDVTVQLEDLASAPAPASLVQNLQTALADSGVTVEVEVLEFSQPEVTGTVLLPPVEEESTSAPSQPKPTPEAKVTPDEEPDDSAPADGEGGGIPFFVPLAGLSVVLLAAVGAGVAYAKANPAGGHPETGEGENIEPGSDGETHLI